MNFLVNRGVSRDSFKLHVPSGREVRFVGKRTWNWQSVCYNTET